MSGIDYRASGNPSKSPGPYLAEVVDTKDETYMGTLQVKILRGSTPGIYTTGSAISAKYMSPFYGVTSLRYEGANSKDFNDVQKSYGMWFVPPDPGTIVMVIFVEGNANECFWIGCVPDGSQNHMVPGIAATLNSAITSAQLDKYKTKLLPVAEFNKSTRDASRVDPDSIPRPVHPFADRLLAQGLLTDTVRGVTSSSARRKLPKNATFVNATFGISTPGPIDKDGRKGRTGTDDNPVQSPISRLGGSTFVMDDGDENGNNELVRIRTRTGHQILLHNSQDLIYIANAPGTAWIEMTSNGKIDIYAADSVSIHSEVDFNFRADRDINLEAGRNINVAAGGNWQVDTTGDFIVNASRNGILSFDSKLDIHASGDIKFESANNLHIKSTILYETASKDVHIVAGTSVYQTASTNINLKATGNIVQSAAIISTNSIPAVSGTKAESAEIATSLDTQELPATSVEKGWGDLYKGKNIQSIMNRVPMHEPWSQHESVNPVQFAPTATDVSNRSGIGSSSRPGLTTTIDYNRAPNIQGNPPIPTGDKAADNKAAFLWMIRVCEGTSGTAGYKTLFTGATFDPDSTTFVATNKYVKQFDGQPNKAYQWADHPNLPVSASISGNGITSTAAGAYQFLYSTWKECQKALNLSDFSEVNQDKACLYLLKRRRALDDVENGNFTSAIAKTNTIWASLPGSPYNQNPKDFGTALALYKQGGGTFTA